MKYIPLDALAAELERRIKKSRDNANIARLNNNHSVTCIWAGHEKECHELKSFIDTLEVKEIGIDLGDPKGDKSAKYIIDTKTLEVKEINLDEHQIADIIQNLFLIDQFIESETLLLNREEALEFARYFFELGIKMRKEE